ncbi:type IX secretion system protein PorQ [Portibacter marinus]|uniref:type IX secretion system protein PorQ n=1 Tax=Portibacter marinus TaxID=2898660 RepID=UPI001F17A07D|nr:type IX secretion system protein PorQ [Portibacter marinus]
MKISLQVFFLVLLVHIGQAQVGGRNVYEFLNLAPSARISALGDYVISVYDDDAVAALLNPAALNSESHTHINFNQTFHFTDIVNGYFNYAHYLENHGLTLHAGLQYIDYGNFDLADEFGVISGEFSAGEQSLILGAAKELNENYSIGTNLKFVFSGLEAYRSSGAALDIGGMYRVEEKRFSAGFVIRNLGTQFSPYDEVREPFPFDVVAGFSKQLDHLPLRFSVIAHHLHRWNISYDDPNLEDNRLFSNSFAVGLDNFFRHLVLNGEFLIGKGGPLRLRVGYNHFRRRELGLQDFISIAGFSGGFGIKAKKWRVDYGFNTYHLAGSVHTLSFGTSVSAFKRTNRL